MKNRNKTDVTAVHSCHYSTYRTNY